MRHRKTRPTDEQLRELDRSYAAYLDALRNMDIRQCPAAWPSDPPGPDYVGTTCDLTDGHHQEDGTPHRHRILGTTQDVTW